MDHPHKKAPSVMAELFGRMPARNASFFVARRLDMRGRKVEVSGPAIYSPVHCFFFITEGEVLISVGDELFFFKQGECAIIPAGQIFSVKYFDDCRGCMGGFSADLVCDTEAGFLNGDGTQSQWGAHKVFFDGELALYVSGLFERLCDEAAGKRNFKIIKAYLAALLTEISEASGNDEGRPEVVATDNALCNKFIELVFDNHNPKATLADYAAGMNISQGYLQKLVKRFTGKSPLAWIHEAMILEARSLLFNTDMTVAEISDKIGVDDPSYFSRLFKKYTGKTPSQYRKNCKKSENSPE